MFDTSTLNHATDISIGRCQRVQLVTRCRAKRRHELGDGMDHGANGRTTLGPVSDGATAVTVLAAADHQKSRAPSPQELDAGTDVLLPKPVILPTSSRRLHGLRDLSACAVLVPPYLLLRFIRLLARQCGVSEHRWKGVPNDMPLSKTGRSRLHEVAAHLLSGSFAGPELLLPDSALPSQHQGSLPKTSLPSDSLGIAALAVLRHVYEVQEALEAVIRNQGLPLGPEQTSRLASKLAACVASIAQRQAVNPQDAFKDLRRVGKAGLHKLCKQVPGVRSAEVLKAYAFQCLMQQSLSMPLRQQRVVWEGQQEQWEGVELEEVCSLVPLDLGQDYLRCFGDQFAEQLAFMAEFPRMRPSAVKKEWEAQAMTINATIHAIATRGKDGQTVQIAAYPRSGAFAVHGRRPRGVGLSGLLSARTRLLSPDLTPQEQATLLQRLQYSSAQALDPEIHIRSVCCIAQALPVVAAGLRMACSQPACLEAAMRAGSFLHVQQSLLSDLQQDECSYLQDTKGALDLLSQRLVIRFGHRPAFPLALDPVTQTITLTLDREDVPQGLPLQGGQQAREEILASTFKLQAVLFSQGVNILQSIGFLVAGDRTELLQDSINRAGLDQLNAYAAAAGRAGSPSLAALNAHYQPGAVRAAKDVEAVWLVRRATAECGGVRAVNCKSGKDRTALELALSLSQEVGAAGMVPDRLLHSLRTALQVGLSYELTSWNSGQPSSYAFELLELACLPSGWAPSWRYCGKVQS
ncbi:hypothetical protein QJQ45_016863 [Haematococcus lacustris]|nr:hypothetical protein QJQ45_016863 [Haematococcus lacustris]